MGQTARRLDKPFEDREFDFNKSDFELISALVYKSSGIVIGESKYNMVYARLSRRLRELGMTRFEDYCRLIQSPEGQEEFMAFRNAMTTNLTRFFREKHHFDHLAQTLTQTLAQWPKPGRLRIWSAGCSTGEEPYSIAMTLREAIPDLDRWDAKILATDLDTNVLAKAARGIYGADSLAEMAPGLRDKYFTPASGGYQVSEKLRGLIAFKPLNLLHSWPMKGPFDAVFCRNVMIYFDTPTKTQLIKRYAQIIKPQAWLYVGHSETLLDQQALFKLAGRTIYKKIGA